MEGWIKLYRKFPEWEWFRNSEMVHLFIYLLLKANNKESRWQGITVQRGQLITGRQKLSQNTGISERSIRTCLERLKSTNEIAIKTTNQYSIITIINYDTYQAKENKNDQQIDQQTDQRTTNDRPTTDQQSTTNKNNKNKENNKNELDIVDKIDFSFFWNEYNKKVGDKTRCQKKWHKLPLEIQQKILDTLPSFISQFSDKQYQPFPETYLNQERWNDEITKTQNNGIIKKISREATSWDELAQIAQRATKRLSN